MLSIGTTHIDEALAHEIVGIVRALARTANSDWGTSIAFFPARARRSKNPQHLKGALVPCRAAESGELVRVDFYTDDAMPCKDGLAVLFCLYLGPFIEGVGQVRVKDTPEGVVVVRVDDRL